MSAYLRSLIKIRTCFPGEAAHWLKNLLHKQQARGLESGFSQRTQMWGECGGLPVTLLRRQGWDFHSKLASYTSCVSKLYVQSRAQASENMMGRNRKILNSTFGLHKHVLAPAQTCTAHLCLRTHAHIPLTDIWKKKIWTQINIRCKYHFNDLYLSPQNVKEK